VAAWVYTQLRLVSPTDLAIQKAIDDRLGLGIVNVLRKYQIISLKITLIKMSNKSTFKGGKNKKTESSLSAGSVLSEPAYFFRGFIISLYERMGNRR